MKFCFILKPIAECETAAEGIPFFSGFVIAHRESVRLAVSHLDSRITGCLSHRRAALPVGKVGGRLPPRHNCQGKHVAERNVVALPGVPVCSHNYHLLEAVISGAVPAPEGRCDAWARLSCCCSDLSTRAVL